MLVQAHSQTVQVRINNNKDGGYALLIHARKPLLSLVLPHNCSIVRNTSSVLSLGPRPLPCKSSATIIAALLVLKHIFTIGPLSLITSRNI